MLQVKIKFSLIFFNLGWISISFAYSPNSCLIRGKGQIYVYWGSTCCRLKILTWISFWPVTYIYIFQRSESVVAWPYTMNFDFQGKCVLQDCKSFQWWCLVWSKWPDVLTKPSRSFCSHEDERNSWELLGDNCQECCHYSSCILQWFSKTGLYSIRTKQTVCSSTV